MPTCEAFFCFQRVKGASLLKGSWYRTKWSKLAYEKVEDDVEGDGDEGDGDEGDGDEGDGDEVDGDEVDGDEVDGDKVDAKPRRKKPAYAVPVLEQLPSSVARTDSVIALTCFKLHSAHAPEVALAARGGRVGTAPSESTNTENVETSAKELASNSTNRRAIPGCVFGICVLLNLPHLPHANLTFTCTCSDTLTHSMCRRSISAKTLARLLMKRYQAAGGKWRKRDFQREIRAYDPGAVSLAGAVMRRLQGLRALGNKMECDLAQGYALCLQRRGFGVALHTCDSDSVREQILEIARKRFNAMRRKNPGLRKVGFRTSGMAQVLSQVDDYVSDDSDDEDEVDSAAAQRERQLYLMGYTLVPPNAMGRNLGKFVPVRSYDMAGKRGRASGVRASAQ